MGWARDQDGPTPDQQTQRVVSFSEVPLEHICWLAADIAERDIRLAPYGLSFTKLAARRQGINPVWYVDLTPGHDWRLRDALNDLNAAALATGDLHRQPAARIFPLFDWMGTWPTTGRQKELWWEREWRHVGNLDFSPQDVALWLCPEEEIAVFEQLLVDEQRQRGGGIVFPAHVIDPRWGLEQIIAHLVGRGDDVMPFH